MNNFLSASSASSGQSLWITVLYMVVVIGIFYFLLMRPQQKKKKKEEKMRGNVQIGDEIITIGGIVGRVVGLKEDEESLIIETGTDRSKLKIKKWAVGSVTTIHEDEEK